MASDQLEAAIQSIIAIEESNEMHRCVDQYGRVVLVGIPIDGKHSSFGEVKCFIWRQKNSQEMLGWEKSQEFPACYLGYRGPSILEDDMTLEDIEKAQDIIEGL